MITNPLLEEKYKAQKQLDEDTGHNIVEYAKNSHRIVSEIEAKYKVKFKYRSAPGNSADNGRERDVVPKMRISD